MVSAVRTDERPERRQDAGGGNQLLTAARCGPLTDTVMTLAMGESIDNWIARQSDINGGQPLTLYAGRRDNYGEECLSYRGPQLLRGAESDPFAVYVSDPMAPREAEAEGLETIIVSGDLDMLQLVSQRTKLMPTRMGVNSTVDTCSAFVPVPPTSLTPLRSTRRWLRHPLLTVMRRKSPLSPPPM